MFHQIARRKSCVITWAFWKICSLATLVAIFHFKLIFYATESRWNWFNLGASSFSLISYWNLYFTIWFQNYLNFIPGLFWTGRRPRTRTSQTMNRTETTVLEKFWDVGGRGWRVDVLQRPASHNTFTKTMTFPENSRKSLSSVVIVLVLVFDENFSSWVALWKF